VEGRECGRRGRGKEREVVGGEPGEEGVRGKKSDKWAQQVFVGMEYDI
jgi:hypothetical protein